MWWLESIEWFAEAPALRGDHSEPCGAAASGSLQPDWGVDRGLAGRRPTPGVTPPLGRCGARETCGRRAGGFVVLRRGSSAQLASYLRIEGAGA